MENASKALLIAAAILIAIVLISLGVMVLGQGSQLVKNADMSSTEITAYNEEFKSYVGTNVRGTSVRQLIEKVNQHNRSNKGDASKIIKLDLNDSSTAKDGDTYEGNATSLTATATTGISSGFSYTVTAQYNSGGLISQITIKKNT